MTKKEFIKLIEDNKNIFRCIIMTDSTIRYNNPHTSIEICWNENNNARSVVKNMRGKKTDIKCIEEFKKYNDWII